MEMFFICCCTWIMAIIFSNAKGTANLNLPTSVNCGDQAVLTCTSTDCKVDGYRFIRDGVTVYNNAGPQTGTDPARYSATVTSASQVLLTISNIQLSDAGTYRCYCGFDAFSAQQALRYECKAVSSIAAITSNKKLSITIDRFYPQPSSFITSMINHTSQLPGTYTCGSSPTLASHYTCTWNSTASLPDGNYGYTIAVITLTDASPVSGSFMIVTPTSPTISNLSTISNNRQVVRGAQDTPLTIQCVSKGGIPAPTLAWYRDNTSTSPLAQSTTSNSVQQPDGTYTVTLIHKFTPVRRDDMTPFLCRVFYPGATAGASPDPSPASAILYLELKPDMPIESQAGEAASGGNMTLRCTSANGRPAPSITWSYREQTYTLTNTLEIDPTSETYTVVSVLQRPVSAVDNGQTATCRVFHTLLSVPLHSVIKVDVKFGPTPGTVAISGNKTTLATGANLLQLNCTSGSSKPASNITWYNGSEVIPNTEGYTRWPGNNNGVISSNMLTITPTRYMDGDRVTCRSDNGYGSDSTNVSLDVLYPCLLQTLPNVTAIEGEPDVTLTCSASSKPPANFTWYKGNIVLANGIGSLTNNTFSYVIPRVDRSYAGSYTCLAGNNVGSPDSKIANLIVKYPPTVTVSATTSPPYTLTCIAEGFPTNFTYQNWLQIWQGYGPVATIPFTGTILNLTDVTYEMSGVYICGASNGINVYDTDVTYVKGNTTVLIKAPPVLTDPSPQSTRIRVAGRLGQNATTEIKYWSNVNDSVVRCYKLVEGSRTPFSSCYVTERVIKITLPVYHYNVTETGTLAAIKITVSREEDLSDFDVVVTNSVLGESVFGITVIPQGPPSTPTITDLSFVAGQVKLTVVPGYHGALNQTIVVQTSTDHKTWHNSSSVNVGKVLSHTTLEISNLQPNNLHYVRTYAFNSEGQSQNYSAVLNVVVKKDEGSYCSSISSTLAVSVSTTAFITIILGIVVIVIVFRRYPNLIMRILQHTCPGNVSKGNEKKTVMQSQTSKESEKQMVFSTLVAAENPTRGENVEATPTYESLNQTRDQSVYTSLEATEEQRNTYENLKRQ